LNPTTLICAKCGTINNIT